MNAHVTPLKGRCIVSTTARLWTQPVSVDAVPDLKDTGKYSEPISATGTHWQSLSLRGRSEKRTARQLNIRIVENLYRHPNRRSLNGALYTVSFTR
jgi:hypothetical protein